MTIGAPPALGSGLVAGLLRAEAYPHPVSEPIRLVETHISWVLLTGQFAYKVKKPLRLSFLDYSTLERRHALCEEEVRLNRRHAPDLYLGVSPIGGSVSTPRVDGSGPALEYAVRMRQFAARDELVALLDSGAVTAPDLEALATASRACTSARSPPRRTRLSAGRKPCSASRSTISPSCAGCRKRTAGTAQCRPWKHGSRACTQCAAR